MSADVPKGLSAHDFPFRLIDRVGLRGAEEATGVCGLTADGFLQDDRSDPARPWPAALIIEAMLQAALPLAQGPSRAACAAGAPPAGRGASTAAHVPPPGYVGAMAGVRLHTPVRAGDRLSITARVVGRHGDLVRVACRAAMEDRPDVVVAEGEFTVSGPPASDREGGRGAGDGTPVVR